jgi:nucleoside-diphosphate-sugar epimerase
MVTGGTGFLGSYVIRDLLAKGEPVIGLDTVTGSDIFDAVLGSRAKDVNIIAGDVTDLPGLTRIVKEHKVDTIIHLATLLRAACEEDPVRAVKVNCEGTANIFEVAKNLKLKRVVWASSVNVFAGYLKGEKLLDDTPPWSTNVYGACKAFNEFLASHYFEKFGVDSIGIRFSIVVGPGRVRGTPLQSELVDKPARGEPATVPFGDGSISWLGVEDASRAILLASDSPTTKTRIFNISGDFRKIKDGVDYIKKVIPEAKITVSPGIYPRGPKVESQAIKDELGFEPRKNMEEIFDDIINHIRGQKSK